MNSQDQFELRLGFIGDRGAGKGRSLQSKLIERLNRSGVHRTRLAGNGEPARSRSGRFNQRGRGASAGAHARGASAWSTDPVSGLRVRARRVVVKARVVRLAGAKAGASAAAHLRYLQRDGVSREGDGGRFYSTFDEEADGKAFLERGSGDRHQFRFIVSPEDGDRLEDLRGFTRELMARMEQDLGTTLDWVAVDHFDTGHPHSHVLVRGVTEEGRILNIAGDYIAHGVRGRACEIMTRWLGPQTELEVREQLAREVGAEKLTTLDRRLIERAAEGRVDLSLPPAAWDQDGGYQQLLVSRARVLEGMELATRESPLTWRLAPQMKEVLADLGRRGDVIATLHRAMTAARIDRRPELYVVDAPGEGLAVTGRLVARGPADDHHERQYWVVDGIDGRSHYLDIGKGETAARIGSLVSAVPVEPRLKPSDRTIAAIAADNGGLYGIDIHLRHDPSATEAFAKAHVRRLEALRRRSRAVERLPDGSWSVGTDFLDKALEAERSGVRASPYRIRILSTLSLDRQASANAPTWLDEQLSRERAEAVAAHGFGGELREALERRRRWLVAEGLARMEGDALICSPDMIARLRARELARACARLGRELGLEAVEPLPGARVEGICQRRVDLSSGSYALVEGERCFSLVPWRPVLEHRLGREVSGVIRRSGAISWDFGRGRTGPEIGM